MLNKIVNTFYILAKEHKLIRTFKYDSLSKSLGIGNDKYPLLFLNEPIYISNKSVTNGQLNVTVNFEVLLTLQQLENYNIKQPTPQDAENIAYHIALNMIAKLRQDRNDDENPSDITVLSYSFLTLERFGDDAAYGVRCTLNLAVDNDITLCDIDEHFDENKEIDISNLLSDIQTDNASGCVEFNYKLPKISI